MPLVAARLASAANRGSENAALTRDAATIRSTVPPQVERAALFNSAPAGIHGNKRHFLPGPQEAGNAKFPGP